MNGKKSNMSINEIYNDINIYNSVYEIEEEKWYDNIPEQGILCWVGDGPDSIQTKRKISIIVAKRGVMYVSKDGFSLFHYAIPVTREEIDRMFINFSK